MNGYNFNNINGLVNINADNVFASSTIENVNATYFTGITSNIQSQINSISGNGISDLQTQITALSTKEASDITTVNTNIATLNTSLNTLSSTVSTNYNTEQTDKTSLQNQISTLSSTVTSNYNTEQADKTSLQTQITNNLATEQADRTSLQTQISTNFSTEQADKAALQTQITTNYNTEQADKTSLQTQINTITGTNLTSLQTQIATNLATEQTDKAALSAQISSLAALELSNVTAINLKTTDLQNQITTNYNKEQSDHNNQQSQINNNLASYRDDKSSIQSDISDLKAGEITLGTSIAGNISATSAIGVTVVGHTGAIAANATAIATTNVEVQTLSNKTQNIRGIDVSSIPGTQNTTFLGQFKIANGVSDKVVFNDNGSGFNTFSSDSYFSNVNVKGKLSIKNNNNNDLVIINDTNAGYNKINILDSQLIIKNGNSNAIVLNEAVTNNSYFLNKTVFSDLNVINGQGIKSLGDTLNIGDSTTLADLNLTTTTYDGAITLTASRINLNANIFINGVALVNGLINGPVFNQY